MLYPKSLGGCTGITTLLFISCWRLAFAWWFVSQSWECNFNHVLVASLKAFQLLPHKGCFSFTMLAWSSSYRVLPIPTPLSSSGDSFSPYPTGVQVSEFLYAVFWLLFPALVLLRSTHVHCAVREPKEKGQLETPLSTWSNSKWILPL